MFETVSVDEAISRGKRIIILPITAIFLGGGGILIWLSMINAVSGMILIAGFGSLIALTWLYWSINITKWRLWAFNNVRNVHELQRKAEQSQLLWPDGSFFEKSEMRSADEKQKWAELHEKFNQKDVYFEDHSLPDETVIRYSRTNLGINIVFGLAMLGLAIYLFAKSISFIVWIFGAAGLFILVMAFRKALDKLPQLILNAKGVETEKNGFTPWNEISNDQVIRRQQGRSTITYFEFNNSNGTTIQTNIDELNISRKELEDMLHTYRIRSEKSKATT